MHIYVVHECHKGSMWGRIRSRTCGQIKVKTPRVFRVCTSMWCVNAQGAHVGQNQVSDLWVASRNIIRESEHITVKNKGALWMLLCKVRVCTFKNKDTV